MSDHRCAPGNDPRHQSSCYRCGKLLPLPPAELILPRDIALERSLTLTACLAGGVPAHVAEGLSAFADSRAWPGGVKQRDFDTETAEEFADARSYLTFGIQPIYQAMLDGDSQAAADYERRMRALVRVVQGYVELRTPCA